MQCLSVRKGYFGSDREDGQYHCWPAHLCTYRNADADISVMHHCDTKLMLYCGHVLLLHLRRQQCAFSVGRLYGVSSSPMPVHSVNVSGLTLLFCRRIAARLHDIYVGCVDDRRRIKLELGPYNRRRRFRLGPYRVNLSDSNPWLRTTADTHAHTSRQTWNVQSALMCSTTRPTA